MQVICEKKFTHLRCKIDKFVNMNKKVAHF